MATMNPVELYHDPTLDDLIQQANPAYHNAPDPPRTARVGQRAMSDDYGKVQQPAGSLSRGAPISYRGIGSNPDPALHRSFSQRAKGRPFAEEAFMDDDGDDDDALDGDRNSGPRRASNTVPTDQQKPEAVGSIPSAAARTPKREGNSVRISSHTNNVGSTTHEHDRHHRSAEHRHSKTRSVSTPLTADQLKESKIDGDNRPGKWAHDRSPLQKLEVKLTDISKEEKRARVQEAELKYLREKKAGKASNRGARGAPLPSEHESTTRHHESSFGSPRNQIAKSSQQNQDQVRTQPRSLPQTEKKPIPAATLMRRVASGDDGSRRISISSKERSSAGNELAEAEPQIAKVISMKQQKPRVRYQHEDRPVTLHERNASHQAALDQLTGSRPTKPKSLGPVPTSTIGSKGRNGDDTGSLGSPVGVDIGSMAGAAPAFDSPVEDAHGTLHGPNHGFDEQSQTSPNVIGSKLTQSTAAGAGLGLQNSKALRSVDSPPASLIDASKHRQRKSSVSFKEPFDRRRPVDEWRGAVTAILTLDDFNLGKVEPPVPKADAADMNTTWWEKSPSQVRKASPPKAGGTTAQPASVIDDASAQFSPRLHLKCGPLLRYCGLRSRRDDGKPESVEREFWRGSIMIVTQDSLCSYEEFPTLRLFSLPKRLSPPPPAVVVGDQLVSEYVDPIAGLTKMGRSGKALYVRPIDHIDGEKDISRIEDDNGIYESSPSPLDGAGPKDVTSATTNKRTLDQDGERSGRFREVKGVRIYADPDRDVTFWRFNLEIELGANQQHIGYRINKGASMGFWVPAKGQTMNIMFHSCNGFSMSVNSNEFSGPDPLWRDVLNNHQTRPFHVMLGGGDQIYNDRVTVDTHWFGGWTKIKNPHAKHHALFTNEMKEELESFYLERYCMWFSQGLFALANSSIPMVNVWDDHDIIDGFGSYPHDFMKTPVFSGLGNIAYKYYMLFQHQSIDAMTEKDEPSWLLGHSPGPYIHTKSRNIFMELGKSVAFLGIDCRTERTKNDVLSIDSLELILDRCRRDMVEGRTKHLIVLLGVPIAYPRLVWLENILTSRAIEPFKALGRAGILKPGLLNKFDGGVEILDDLDDHWTASHHKYERNVLVQELQDLAAEKSARITILSGDVHLAAIGQFYSNPKLKIPKDKDHRYMPNIISSAIVNTPPPDMMADVLNKRNKVHHLDEHTDENMIPMFTHDVDHSKRNNTRLLPRRNWCAIREYHPGQTPPPTPSLHSELTEEEHLPDDEDENFSVDRTPKRRLSFGASDLNPINLVRRFSSRRAPPSAYRDDTTRLQYGRSASFDGDMRPQGTGQRPGSGSGSHMRASSADRATDIEAMRPSFHRRPTNLSEKAARKGIVPAVDGEGNEIDVNDHSDLEGGLDIVINCEVDKRFPTGITVPYRFLVPALWYDGSSDRVKLDQVAKPSRKASVLNKFGLGLRPSYRTIDPQAGLNEDDSYSGTESYDDPEVDKRPHRTFSLFGSKSKRKQVLYEDNHPQMEPTKPQSTTMPTQLTVQRAISQPTSQQAQSFPLQTSIKSQSLAPPTAKEQPYPPPRSPQQHQAVDLDTDKQDRRPSFTIGEASPIPIQIPSPLPHEQFYSSEPYDADATYIDQQQRATHEKRVDYKYPSVPQRQSSSKSDRILGITSDSDQYPNHSIQLRGNGILGKNMPPTAFRSEAQTQRPGSSSSDSAATKGYSGIEAYRDPKQKRRWSLSLRDRARGLMDSLEGRNGRRRDDLYSDDDEEEFWEGPKQDYPQAAPVAFQPQKPQSRPQPQPQHPYQNQQRQHPQPQTRGHNRSASNDRGLRQWGPVYSYEKGRVYPYDNVQEGQQGRHY